MRKGGRGGERPSWLTLAETLPEPSFHVGSVVQLLRVSSPLYWEVENAVGLFQPTEPTLGGSGSDAISNGNVVDADRVGIHQLLHLARRLAAVEGSEG